MKSSVPSRVKSFSSLSPISDLVGERALDAGALAREGQEIGFAHVEIEIERIERDQRRQQRGRAGCGAAARDQASDRNLARADAPGEGRAHAAIFEIELGIPHPRLGVLDRGLRSILVVGALVDRLLGCELVALKRLRPRELVVGERHAGGRGLQRRLRLFQPDLVGPRIDDEQQVALVDDLAVLEMDLGQRAADLGPQFDPVDRRELAEKANPGIDVALQGLADRHERGRRRRRRRLVCLAGAQGRSQARKRPSSYRCAERGRFSMRRRRGRAAGSSSRSLSSFAWSLI